MEKNEYGRRTWDVEAYARDGVKRVKTTTNDNHSSNNGTDQRVDTGVEFGEERSWFNCALCRRRFKDTLKLAEHMSSKQHLENTRREKGSGDKGDGDVTDPEITVENVEAFVRQLDQSGNI